MRGEKSKIQLKLGFTAVELFFWLAVAAFIVGGLTYKNFFQYQAKTIDRGLQAEKDAKRIVEGLEQKDLERQQRLQEP